MANVPDHSTFSKNRHGRFRESNLLRKLFETIVDNYLIDLKHAVIMDVEATTTIRQAEVGAAKTMLDRTAERFEVAPSRLVADAGYGSAEMVGWLVDERGIEPHVKLMDKSERTDGTFSRSDFVFDFRGQPLCLSRRQRAEEISSLIPQARRADEGRHDDLLCAQAGLPRLRAQAPVLSERACAQNRALCS